MTRVAAVMAATILGSALVPAPMAAARRRPQLGVFGTINGKTFKATNIHGAGDPCVMGRYEPSTGTVVFAAIECRSRRRRQGAVRKNYKTLVIACARYDQNASLVPPYEVPCPGSVYGETKTGRFRQPVSMTQWLSNTAVLPDFTLTSDLRMRVDAFDGTNVRGAFYGVFELPAQGSVIPGPAEIDGEVRFDFPFVIQ